MRTIEQMIEQEVYTNVNELIQHFADCGDCNDELLELVAGKIDHEEAAIQLVNSWSRKEIIEYLEGWGVACYDDETTHELREAAQENLISNDIDDLTDCEDYRLEPLEFYIVSKWFAEKLEQENQSVSFDIYGLCVWGRYTSGQCITQDGCIKNIYDKLHKTKVVFRQFAEGDAIALFPEEVSGIGFIGSYQRIGQHSGASSGLIKELKPATDEQKAELQAELERIGYVLDIIDPISAA